MKDSLYSAFEEKYRGSREQIKSRLQVYMPFIEPLFKTYPNGKALDLGCGRGEWLELLNEKGFFVNGVDLNEGMLQSCRDRQLRVEKSDALTYLQKVKDQSLCLVTAFHLVEHLSFDLLQLLVFEAKRVLLPGGLLILETPNPENITVGTNSFYLDPTHIRPLPSGLLSFLPEYYGFERIKVLRLQEQVGLSANDNPSLIQVLDGVSPDYSIVAQTLGSPDLMEELAVVFALDFGQSLSSLADRFQSAINNRLSLVESKAKLAETQAQTAEAIAQRSENKAQQAESKAQQAESKAQQAETKAQQAESKAQQAETKAQQAETMAQHAETMAQQAETMAQQAKVKAQQAEVMLQLLESKVLEVEFLSNQYKGQLHAVHNSKSWRMTAPLRWFVTQFRLLRQYGLIVRSKALIKKIIISLIPFVIERPKLRTFAIRMAYRLGIAERLKPLVRVNLNQDKVVSVQQLRSVRIMIAMSNLSIENTESPVTFLEVSDDAR